jgi:nitrite reductase (NO-forming)
LLNVQSVLLRISCVAILVLAACHRADPPQDDFLQVVGASTQPDVTSTPEGHPVMAQLTSAPEVPAKLFRRHPAHVIVSLTINEVEKEISPGVRYTFWTFGGQVPGKFIRVRQGDIVEVHLKNDPANKLPHNIDLHAVTGPGGGAASTFTAPGHESSFTFRATPPGLYVYHCATAPVPMHVANGMYGLILVDPAEPLPRVDREYYLMQGELYTAGKYHAPGLQAFDMDKGIDEKPTYVLFNGSEGALVGDKALTAKTGERVRLYVYHCATAPVPMHVANGMYGLILVEPPGGFPPVSHEYYVMQGELYTSGAYHAPGLQTFDMQKGIDERPTYVVFDGAEGSLVGDKALTAKTGDTIRIFFGNAGPNLDANFHIIGAIFDRVYPEGGSVAQEHVQTTLVPAGGATIVELTVDVPGTYSLVDHALFRAFNKGAVGQLKVEGPTRKDMMSPKKADLAYGGAPVVEPPIKTDGDPVLAMGAGTFGRICAACHLPTGLGVPGQFPPLAHSDYLAASAKEKIIGHVLHGLQGPLVVNGMTYNGQMPALNFLSDAEVAAVLTYARASFGNGLSRISPDEVAKVRGQTASAP